MSVARSLVDGVVPKGFPDGIPPMPGTGSSALGLPTHVEAAKINNLLRTNPQSSLATLIDFPVTEATAPRTASARALIATAFFGRMRPCARAWTPPSSS